jgi:hypothetical protein
MKYKLLEDHQVRSTETVLKAGIYTLEQLQEAHTQDSLDWCLKYTKLSKKLILFIEEAETREAVKTKKEK